MKNEKIKLMCITGVFTAITYIFTAYFHIPSHTGYTHIGDAFIYIAACLLPLPYAATVGAVGALLADCLTGFAIWAPASVIIKSLAVLCFSRKNEKIVCLRNILALIPAWFVCIFGYYFYESIITCNFIAPFAGIAGYITQCTLSSIVFIILGSTLDKIKAKNYIFKGEKIR